MPANAPTSAQAALDTYCAAVNAKDTSALRALFAPDAVLLNPFGEYHGIDAIMGFYNDLVLANDVTVEPTNVIGDGDQCAAELDGRTPATPEVQRMIDVFTVDAEGRVTRLSIYRR